MRLRALRLFLGLAAVTWLAAVPGVFLSWNTAIAAMEGFGARPIEYDKMLDYWLRMASGAFGLIGCLYLLPTIRPRRFQEFVPWLGSADTLHFSRPQICSSVFSVTFCSPISNRCRVESLIPIFRENC